MTIPGVEIISARRSVANLPSISSAKHAQKLALFIAVIVETPHGIAVYSRKAGA